MASAIPLTVEAATFYVRVSGSDANDGLSPSQAVRSIKKAATLARPGDAIIVGPGRYEEGDIAPAASGRISFIADRRGTRVGDPPGDVIVDATGFDTGFEFNRTLAGTIDGFVVYGATIGIYVKSQSHRALITNNIVSNNVTNGIYVQDSNDVVVFNNLVYNNDRAGILITGNVEGSLRARVVNNTVYRNRNRGIFFAGTTIGSPYGVVINNIVQENWIAGIQINSTSRQGYVTGGNVTFENRFASGTPIDVTDIEADPLFLDPVGRDGILGGEGYPDDDFRLSQRGAGQAVNSPAVDTGSDGARHLRLHRASTRSDGRKDRGMVDAGYHYDNFETPPADPARRVRYKPLYVSAARGNDTNDGDSRARALQTLNRALAVARPGHRIVLLGGTYREGELRPRTSGTAGRPLFVQGTLGATVDAAGASRAFTVVGQSHIVIDGVQFTGASGTAVEIRNSFGEHPKGSEATNVILRRCRIYGNGRRGLYVNNAHGVRVESCVIEDNGSRGIVTQGGELSIARSVIRRNPDSGLWAFAESDLDLLRTEFSDNAKDALLIEQSDVTIVGAIIRGSKNGGLRFRNGAVGIVRGVTITDITDAGVQNISSSVDIADSRIERCHVGIQAFPDPVTSSITDVTVRDTRVCSHAGSGVDVRDTAISLSGVVLCDNAREGLRQKGGNASIADATITGNLGKGVSITDGGLAVVDRAVICDNRSNGLQVVTTASLSVSSSVLCRNGVDGLTIMDVPSPLVWNNLVYRNNKAGIYISGNVTGSPDARVLSNTVYGNADRGLLLGGGDASPPCPGGWVLRNIFAENDKVGIQVNRLSLVGYVGDYNLNVDGYGPGTPLGANDVLADPDFVHPDQEDFRLSQRAAGQRLTSPAVDAGGVSVSEAAMHGMTTRTDGLPDTGMVDLGYHYYP